MFFFIERNCSFFMGSIFWSNVVLVLTFNTGGVYNFITKKVNIPVNLVPFFNVVSFLFCRFLKSGVTNVLKSLFLFKSKKARVIYSKQDKAAVVKTLVWSVYVWRTATATFFFLKISFSNSLYLKKSQCRRHDFRFQLTLTSNITPINFSLSILEKKLN